MEDNKERALVKSNAQLELARAGNMLTITKKLLSSNLPSQKEKNILLVNGEKYYHFLYIMDATDAFGDQINFISYFNGTDALEFLKNNIHKIDLIISNINMRGMDGIELCRASKQLAPQIPFLIHATWDYRDDFFKDVLPDLRPDIYLVISSDSMPFIKCLEELLHIRRGNYINAVNVDILKKVSNDYIKTNPDDAYTYYNRGEAYAELGDHRQAIKDYKKAAKLGNKEAQGILRSLGFRWWKLDLGL